MSLGLVREDGPSLYLVYPEPEALDPWVKRNVVPRIGRVPAGVPIRPVDQVSGARALAAFLAGDRAPRVIADWPDDVRLFCQALMLGPGQTVPLPHLSFDILAVESYPTDVEGAVEHNAWWDAMVLRRRLMRHEMADGDHTPPAAGRADGAAIV